MTRFAPFVSLDAILLIVVFLGGVGFQDADNAQGPLYGELLAAARAPAAYQIAMVFDAFGWLALAVSLIAFSRIVRSGSPILSTFIFLAGVGHLLGFVGGLLRMTGVHDLAVEYAATTDPVALAAIRTSFLALYAVIGGLFTAGDVLGTLGWLLVGLTTWRTRVLARWVAGWTLFSGIVVALFTVLSLADPQTAFPLLLVYIVAGVVLFHLVFAAKFWRSGSPVPTSD